MQKLFAPLRCRFQKARAAEAEAVTGDFTVRVAEAGFAEFLESAAEPLAGLEAGFSELAERAAEPEAGADLAGLPERAAEAEAEADLAGFPERPAPEGFPAYTRLLAVVISQRRTKTEYRSDFIIGVPGYSKREEAPMTRCEIFLCRLEVDFRTFSDRSGCFAP
jgi:hypothetical protein